MDWQDLGDPGDEFTDAPEGVAQLPRTPLPSRLLALVVALSVMVLSPALLAAAPTAAGWSLTATPTSVQNGQTHDIAMRLTDTDGSGDIGCLRLVVPAEGKVVSVTVTATSAPSPWVASVSGSGPTTIRVYNDDGNGKLKGGDWVDFIVRVHMQPPGTYTWTGAVVQNDDCTGSSFLAPITISFTVSPGHGPTPTPTPTPSPTPTPTPTPTPRRHPRRRRRPRRRRADPDPGADAHAHA